MIPNIEIYYQRIADAILAELPQNWISAQLIVIFYPDSATWEPEFQMKSGEAQTFDISLELVRTFKELRGKFKEAGHSLWGQACFTLSSDGTFSMKWGYDNCDENGDTIWNEEEWNRRFEERRRRLSQ